MTKSGLFICTLISENQGLEKLRSFTNLRKIAGPAHLDLFSVCHLEFFHVYGINLAFCLKSRFAGPEIFLRFEADLDFQKPRCRLKGHFEELSVRLLCVPHTLFFASATF